MIIHPTTNTKPLAIALLGIVFLLNASNHPSIAQNALPEGISEVELGHGWRFVDKRGMTLYHFESDQKEPRKSFCDGECASIHPPLLAATSNIAIPSNWSRITRHDGTKQWAYKDMPVYTFARESNAGATDGEGDGWSIVFKPLRTPFGLTTAKTVLGHVLASQENMTLYVRTDDAAENCNAQCLANWPPVLAPWIASGFGDFSVLPQLDGNYQWAYKKQPLHLYTRDSGPGDVRGEGVDGVWRVMILEPAPAHPPWVRVVKSDAGELLADSNGMTLYALHEEINIAKYTYLGSEECLGECISKNWKAAKPAAMATPIGNWSIRVNKDKSLQWTHMGKPVFTSKLENTPGDLSAILLRSHMSWRPIMYRIPAIQGTRHRVPPH